MKTQTALYIIILEKKAGSMQAVTAPRSIHCVAPDTNALLRFYANTYQQYYWQDEFIVNEGNKETVFFDIYKKIHQKDIRTLYLTWFGEMMGRFIKYIYSQITHHPLKEIRKLFMSYIKLTLQKQKNLSNAIMQAFGLQRDDQLGNLYHGLLYSMYYIATEVMGYQMPFLFPATDSQKN